MIIENEPLLASYRRIAPCSWCGEKVMLCAHHVFSKGSGRIDAPFNLVALGMNALTDCDCHARHHNGNRPPRGIDLLAIAAQQNDTSQGDIKQLVYLIRRLDRDTTREQMFDAIKRECRPSARDLARRTL